MAAKNTKVRAMAEAIRTRNRSFRRNPTIWPQPPTKPPKYRRNNYNTVSVQVCALSGGKILACKLLILIYLREGSSEPLLGIVPARHTSRARNQLLKFLSSLFP